LYHSSTGKEECDHPFCPRRCPTFATSDEEDCGLEARQVAEKYFPVGTDIWPDNMKNKIGMLLK
jgi:hypothetical protein